MNATLETAVTSSRSIPPPATMQGSAALFAAEMQSTLVPPLCHRGNSVEVHGQCCPKEDVGGDLMDFVADGHEAIAYVADVSGHGLRAGVLMGMIKTAMRYGLLLRRPLMSLISDLNHLLPQIKQPSMFATLAALRFDGANEAEYVSAGHVPLLHYRKRTNDVIRHYAEHFPLGLLPGDVYASRRIRFEVGDIFVLLTDGAVELGEERDSEAGFRLLAQALWEVSESSLPEISDSLLAEITQHGAQHDDRTLLLVRTLSASSSNEQPNQSSCSGSGNGCDLLEARWRKVLSNLAAGFVDD